MRGGQRAVDEEGKTKKEDEDRKTQKEEEEGCMKTDRLGDEDWRMECFVADSR